MPTNKPLNVQASDTNTSAKPAKPRRGRPVEHRTGDTLAAIYFFSKEGAVASATEIAQMLEISTARAIEILEQLSTEHTDYSDPILPLCSTENAHEYLRIEAPGSLNPKALRLTPAQAKACTRALDGIGMPKSHNLRQKLEQSFFPLDMSIDNKTEPAAEQISAICEALITCAQSITLAKRTADSIPSISAPIVSFMYQGSNDTFARTRRIVPLFLHAHEDTWLIEAFDIDAKARRTFRASLIQEPHLTNQVSVVSLGSPERPEGGKVELTCNTYAASHVLTWDGAHVISQDGDSLVIEVPYFRGDWLPRHVLSLGTNVTYKDARLSAEVRTIAAENLNRASKIQGLGA